MAEPSPDEALRRLREGYQYTGSMPVARERLRGWASAFDIDSQGIEALVQQAENRLIEIENQKITTLRPATLAGQTGQESWYAGPAEEDLHWPRVRAHLQSAKKFDNATVRSVDEQSDAIVARLGNPRDPEFDVRGMVVGHVQSGKTANLTSVIAKAVDRGYKLVIVLAGLTNSLRRQTQERLEGDLLQHNKHNWHQLTEADQEGDFRGLANSRLPALAHDCAYIAVVKKETSTLRRLLDHLRNSAPLPQKWPALLIDDECDSASPNGSGRAAGMTRINQLVRDIAQTLPRVSYVGYTATPFANVLIDPRSVNGQPPDLYPKDFIHALPRPHNYFGAESIFGRDPINLDDEPPEGLEMIRPLPAEEVELLRPSRQADRQDFQPVLPPSLKTAIRYYLMATAARAVRGQEAEHSSMLVHVVHYTVLHERINTKIKEYLTYLAQQLSGPSSELVEELRKQWSWELSKVPPEDLGRDRVTFEQVIDRLPDIIGEVTPVVENAESDERLVFDDSTPRRYIAVGGNVLSRGLTIEGLVVSYFARTSRQYDTLLQMGRWFGFRPGYEDLPRIWMPDDVKESYRELASVEEELREDIRVYGEQNVTPLQFAVRIRRISGLMVTAPSRMVAARTVDVSYSDRHLQTFKFHHRNREWLEQNLDAGRDLVSRIVEEQGEGAFAHGSGRRGRCAIDVPVTLVERFLDRYRVHADHRHMYPGFLRDYIARCRSRGGEDAEIHGWWNVGIVEPDSSSVPCHPFGPLSDVNRVIRSRLKDGPQDADIKALMSRSDLEIDCQGLQVSDTAGWADARRKRQELIGARPLLLLYLIDKESPPFRQSRYREPLGAAEEVLGLGLVFPNVGVSGNYVAVDLPEAAEEPDGEADDVPDYEGDEAGERAE